MLHQTSLIEISKASLLYQCQAEWVFVYFYYEGVDQEGIISL